MTDLFVIVRLGAAGVQLNTRPDEPQTVEADGLTYQFRSVQTLIDLHRCLSAALAAKAVEDG